MQTHKRRDATAGKTIEIDATETSSFGKIQLDNSPGIALSKDTFMTTSLEASVALEYKGYQALVDRTVDVFGDEVTASRWLSMPSVDFGNRTPIEAAEEVSYDPLAIEELFEPVFIRIEHGVDW